MDDQLYNQYPGIVRVEFFDVSLLASDRPDLDSLAGLSVQLPEERFNIPLLDPGTAEVRSVDGFDSLSLKFSAQLEICPAFRPAFLFHDACGRSFLVASKAKPFPKISKIRSFGSVPDSRPEVSYEISHTAIKTPIEVLITNAQ